MASRSKITSKITAKLPLGSVAILLIVTTLIGQLIGFMRTRLINANFDTFGPHSTDAFFAASKIPDFFFFTLAAGALGVAFMPVLSDRLHKNHDRKGMWDLSASLANMLSIVMLLVGVVIFIFAPFLVQQVVGRGFNPQSVHNTVVIMRWLAFTPLLFTISGVLTATQQTLGRFFFYAIAPIFYNLTIIISIFVFKHNIGLVGLGIGALAGGVLQLIIVAFGVAGTGFRWHFKIKWKTPDFRTILRQLPPRSLDQGMDQLIGIVETSFASKFISGSVAYYSNAFILHTAPILLLGTAISTAAFPQLNKRLSQNRPDLFRSDFIKILKSMIWLAMPIVVVSFFARGYLARMLFAKGAPVVSMLLGFLTVAIFFRIMYAIMSRWFYSQKDSKTPLYVSVVTIVLNIVLVYLLTRPSSYGLSGLAIAESLVSMIEVIILFVIMKIRDSQLFRWDFLVSIVRILSVTGFTIIAGYSIVSFLPLSSADRGFLSLGTKFGVISIVTIGVHLAISWLFDLPEARPFVNKLKKFVFKSVGRPF